MQSCQDEANEMGNKKQRKFNFDLDLQSEPGYN